MRLIVVEALEREGHAVEEAVDGRELLARATRGEHEERELDLIVSDVRMPGMTGMQVLEILRSSERTTPVILMTAFGGPELRERARRLDAVMFDKPFSVPELRAEVARILERRGRIRPAVSK